MIPNLTRYITTLKPSGADTMPGHSLALGFTLDPSNGIAQPVVQLANEDISRYVALSVNDVGALMLSLNLIAEAAFICAEPEPLYLLADITFGLDGLTFSGSVNQQCKAQTIAFWQGNSVYEQHNYARELAQ